MPHLDHPTKSAKTPRPPLNDVRPQTKSARLYFPAAPFQARQIEPSVLFQYHTASE